MLPNATDDGLSDNCPGAPDAPEAVNDTTTSEFAPISETVRDKLPTVDG
jgi:hypothetical protein